MRQPTAQACRLRACTPQTILRRLAPQRPSVPNQSHRHIAAAAVAGDAGADGIVYGKPQAPQEIWEGIAQTARTGLREQIRALSDANDGSGGAAGDLVMAALHVSAEDDAVNTRTHIPLPVAAFSARLDALLSEIRGMMPVGLAPRDQLEFMTRHLYSTWGLKVAKSIEEGVYSPYRVYMNMVLAQKCGTGVACGAVLYALLARARSAGVIDWRAAVIVPPGGASEPSAVLLEEGQGEASADVGPLQLLAGLLDQLKRAYWSWDWPTGLVGTTGRAGRVSRAVGVMQSVGRPFGNVQLALLASERLCEVTASMPGGTETAAHQLQARDWAVQLLHVGLVAEGVAVLEQHVQWARRQATAAPGDAGRGADADAAIQGSLALCEEVLLSAQRRLLEAGLAAGGVQEAVNEHT